MNTGSKSKSIPAHRQKVFDLLVRRARHGEPAPTNGALAAELLISPATVMDHIAHLVRADLIHIERMSGNRRKITVLATGEATDWTALSGPSGAPAYRTRKRPCISCGEMIKSHGPHHRMCAACRSPRAGLGPVDTYRIAR